MPARTGISDNSIIVVQRSLADLAGVSRSLVLLGDGPGPSAGADVEVIRAVSRTEGWRRATGERVAFFDTRYEAGAGWAEAAFAGDGVRGGCVLPGEGYGWAAWVFYVVEYGWKGRLAAGNIVYGRGDFRDELAPGPGRVEERMNVRLARTPGFAEYLGERYRYSKEWGARHVSRKAAVLRLALPLVVLARSPWWRKPATLPGVAAVSVAMMCGEIYGSLRGGGGRGRVRARAG